MCSTKILHIAPLSLTIYNSDSWKMANCNNAQWPLEPTICRLHNEGVYIKANIEKDLTEWQHIDILIGKTISSHLNWKLISKSLNKDVNTWTKRYTWEPRIKITSHNEYHLKLTQKKTPKKAFFSLHPLSNTKGSAGSGPSVLLQEPCKDFPLLGAASLAASPNKGSETEHQKDHSQCSVPRYEIFSSTV